MLKLSRRKSATSTTAGTIAATISDRRGRMAALLLALTLLLGALGGLPACEKAGYVTGSAVQGVHDAAKDFKKGYKDGRHDAPPSENES